MSLLSTYDSQNMRVISDLLVRYNVANLGTYCKYTRTASKQYEYLGLTKAAASACAAAKLSKYTRTCSSIGVKNSSTGIPTAQSKIVQCASVSSSHDGDRWRVVITVNETDVKCVSGSAQSPAIVFATENARDYDNIAALRLLSVTRTGAGATVGYTIDIRGSHGVVYLKMVSATETISPPVAASIATVPTDPFTATLECDGTTSNTIYVQ